MAPCSPRRWLAAPGFPLYHTSVIFVKCFLHKKYTNQILDFCVFLPIVFADGVWYYNIRVKEEHLRRLVMTDKVRKIIDAWYSEYCRTHGTAPTWGELTAKIAEVEKRG